MRTRRLYVAFGAAVASAVAFVAASAAVASERETRTPAAEAPSSTSGAGASSACSRANALRAMTRYNLLSDPQLPRPIGPVLCGAFAGPGSRGMAVSSVHGVCLPYAGWGVFRYVNGDWELVPGGRHDIILTPGIAKSGNDIVEKATIRYPGETVCTASGTRARVWHWNGSRLVAGPWKVISTGATTVHLDDFVSQDRFIWCRLDARTAFCGKRVTAAGSRDFSATLKANGDLSLCDLVLPAQDVCTGNYDPQAPALRHGQKSEIDGFRCASEANGITCTVIAGAGKGKGFLVGPAGASRVGP